MEVLVKLQLLEFNLHWVWQEEESLLDKQQVKHHKEMNLLLLECHQGPQVKLIRQYQLVVVQVKLRKVVVLLLWVLHQAVLTKVLVLLPLDLMLDKLRKVQNLWPLALQQDKLIKLLIQ